MVKESDDIRDVAIIGGGPVGLFAIFQCGMVGLTCDVIDALDDLGGQCTALYPAKPIYDIPAYPTLSGAELVANLMKQASPFDFRAHLGQQVTHFEKDAKDGLFHLKTSKGKEIIARAVIIAAGAGAFGPNRPPLANIEEYEGSAVFYYVRDPQDFKGRDIVIAGGGDSALDWAIVLADIADHVTLVHRRDRFRAAPETVRQMRALVEAGKITLKTGFQLGALGGDGKTLSAVILKTMSGDETRIEADCLLPFFGLSNDLGPIAQWGLALSHKDISVDPLTQATNIEGVYAIGDICAYENKLKLILTGFSEAALAAHQIRAYLFPDQEFHFEYSTTKGVPTTIEQDDEAEKTKRA